LGGEGILIALPLPPRGELARKAAGMGRQWLPKGQDPVAELTDDAHKPNTTKGWSRELRQNR